MCKFDGEFVKLNFVTIEKDGVYFNGEKLPVFPKEIKSIKYRVDNGTLYLNGYVLKNGVWRKTIKSMLYNVI